VSGSDAERVESGSDTERVVHGLRIRLDREICVGFGDCVTAAPGALELDADGLVVFEHPEGVTREDLVRAARACPVDAILIWDAEGRPLAP
jgi:ferredoxin